MHSTAICYQLSEAGQDSCVSPGAGCDSSREGTHGPTGLEALTGFVAEDMHSTAICYQLSEAGQDI